MVTIIVIFLSAHQATHRGSIAYPWYCSYSRFNSSSAVSIINAYAAQLTAKRFSKLLRTPNTEGHTALYQAIMNLTIAFLSWDVFISRCFWVQLYYKNYLLSTPVETMIRLIVMFM
ncbi:hypothetical protein BDR04DRAFT_1095554 [Suillus decipiens]|nr:hypothetical protein BDR04DRAFT_1095554 [Suillus decipiens]